MISAIKGNDTTFTSVMPVRVRIDGLETFNSDTIRSACRQLSNVLIGPTKETETKNIAIIRTFSNYDSEYNLLYGISGYPIPKNKKKVLPSDYFRYICDDKKRNFFLTGPQAVRLRELGENIGTERKTCKQKNIPNSFDLNVANGNYWGAIKHFIRNKQLRITEKYDYTTGQRTGSPVTLIIDMISNKKYGLSTFKMKLNEISFEKS